MDEESQRMRKPYAIIFHCHSKNGQSSNPDGVITLRVSNNSLRLLTMDFQAASKLGVEKHKKNVAKIIQYGTAGFRSNIGVMITASHNPECDNGIKLVDPYGEMMESSWESLATNLVNVSDEGIGDVLNEIIKSCNIDVNQPANVVVARDTRHLKTCLAVAMFSALKGNSKKSKPILAFCFEDANNNIPKLAEAVRDGIQVLGGNIQDHGILSTPQLHYIVCCINTNEKYGEATESGYFKKLSSALIKLFGDSSSIKQGYAICCISGSSRGARLELVYFLGFVKEVDNYRPVIIFDGANGVGALKMNEFSKYISEILTVEVVNDGTSGQLNHLCGADYVKVQQKPPPGLSISPGTTCVSVDGDADRVVYYYLDDNNKFHLLDGDKIATLIAGYLQEVIKKSGLQLNLGLVQTAYANGSSTNYISNTLKVPVSCVPTGVKHLHHKALEYDVGVYFEANGHGTVIFSKDALNKIEKARNDESLSSDQKISANYLSNLVDVINQVADRTIITTTDAERKCSSPSGLQEAIDELDMADQLAHEVSVKVYEMAAESDYPSLLQFHLSSVAS
ncbi:Phosphoacetylglucosamine mutase [Nymphon striatum]|nr:Phosphoacetylglucosamine mutase [Nymphon striatum]